jgi:hypothetical protein
LLRKIDPDLKPAVRQAQSVIPQKVLKPEEPPSRPSYRFVEKKARRLVRMKRIKRPRPPRQKEGSA